MKSQNPIAWVLLLVLPLGFAGIWRLQHGIDAQRESLSQERDDVLLRSGKLVKVMSLEYAPLLADIYWTRVCNTTGTNTYEARRISSCSGRFWISRRRSIRIC